MGEISDNEIVEMLQSSNTQKEDAALSYLHRTLYNKVIQFARNYKGSMEDGEDLLQESLMSVFKLARLQKLPDDVNIKGYLFTSCKNRWFRKLKRLHPTMELSDKVTQLPIEDPQIKNTLEDEQGYLLNILQHRIGDTCYRLLVYFYYEGRKMKEIANLMSFGNEQVAKNRKSKCMKKLKELMVQEPGFKKAFQ